MIHVVQKNIRSPRHIFLIILCAAMFLSSSAVSLTASDSDIGRVVIEKAVFERVNQERQKHRLKKLAWDPGHRANILSGDYETIGVGAAQDAKGYYYITQNFR